LTRSTSAAKWWTKSSSGSQASPGVDVEVRQGGTRRCLAQQGADRLAFVKSERGDVDQANDVGRVGAERGDDLAAVGVADDGWAVLVGQDLAQPGDVIGQPGHRELGCGDAVAVGLQVLDDSALEPSAHAPCTRTMSVAQSWQGSFPVGALCYSVLPCGYLVESRMLTDRPANLRTAHEPRNLWRRPRSGGIRSWR
jgi:hypothetical protein